MASPPLDFYWLTLAIFRGDAHLKGYDYHAAFAVTIDTQTVTAFSGQVVAGHLDGHARIHAAEDGQVQWDYETMRSFQSISGHQGQGGSISGGGAVVHGVHLLINCGPGQYFHEPGKVLLVFSSEK